ncbi:hypothetical protein [Saccharothrix sp. HUAS TT1]|uniref:hypothetical protein n=1 Tax=unclassified Saccharothrix TaxID=2593673 RepID=UPI00345C550A
MERRRLIALVGGLALLGGVVAVLRDEAAPPKPRAYERFLDERVEHVPDTGGPTAPSGLELAALDRTSLRASWTSAGGFGGFEVRWNGRTRLVHGLETELTDLDANADTAVEVRALDEMGNRSEPATATAVPRLAYDEASLDDLVAPIDVFDGPEALTSRRWRVFDGGNAHCLGLRPLNGKRLEVNCDAVDLQSNVPLQLGAPGADGAIGRVVLVTDGPAGHRPEDSELVIALLPEPFHDTGRLDKPFPPGAVVLRVTPFGARFDLGGTTSTDETPGAHPPPTPGVRHRWELRVLPGSVVALRDGVEVATAPVNVPWTTARPRLSFRKAEGTRVDMFGIGGRPTTPVPASLVQFGFGLEQADGSVEFGNAYNPALADASSVRVVASVVAEGTAPITVELGTRSAPAVVMPPDQAIGRFRPSVVYADFPLPLPEPERNPKVRLRSDATLTAYHAHLVIADGQDARRPAPRLTDRPLPDPQVPAPAVFVQHRSPLPPSRQFPHEGELELVVELEADRAQEVAAVKGVEIDLDGEPVVVLPTNGSAGGRHGFTLRLADVPTGRHSLDVRVVPVDERWGVRSHQQTFEVRPL